MVIIVFWGLSGSWCFLVVFLWFLKHGFLKTTKRQWKDYHKTINCQKTIKNNFLPNKISAIEDVPCSVFFSFRGSLPVFQFSVAGLSFEEASQSKFLNCEFWNLKFRALARRLNSCDKQRTEVLFGEKVTSWLLNGYELIIIIIIIIIIIFVIYATIHVLNS